MKKLTLCFIYSCLCLTSINNALAAGGVKVKGASLEEIASRTESGISSFYRLLSLGLVIVGLFMFAACIIRLVKINQGQIPDGKMSQAFLGMVFSAMLTSTGAWLFAASNTLKSVFS